MATNAPVKPPCPNCTAGNKYVYWDNEKHRYFCWKNPAKDKLGCGHLWAPHERGWADTTAQAAAPPPPQASPPATASPGPPPQESGSRVTALSDAAGREVVVYTAAKEERGRFVRIDANNNLHIHLIEVNRLAVFNAGIWNRLEFVR